MPGPGSKRYAKNGQNGEKRLSTLEASSTPTEAVDDGRTPKYETRTVGNESNPNVTRRTPRVVT